MENWWAVCKHQYDHMCQAHMCLKHTKCSINARCAYVS